MSEIIIKEVTILMKKLIRLGKDSYWDFCGFDILDSLIFKNE